MTEGRVCYMDLKRVTNVNTTTLRYVNRLAGDFCFFMSSIDVLEILLPMHLAVTVLCTTVQLVHIFVDCTLPVCHSRCNSPSRSA